MPLIVHGSESFTYLIIILLCSYFLICKGCVAWIPRQSDTFPVSDMTSGPTTFARSLKALKPEFQCFLILCSNSVIILYLRLQNIHCLHGTHGVQTLAFNSVLESVLSAFLTGLSGVASTCCVVAPGDV